VTYYTLCKLIELAIAISDVWTQMDTDIHSRYLVYA